VAILSHHNRWNYFAGFSAIGTEKCFLHPFVKLHCHSEEKAMETFACEELDSLTRRLKCAIERKNELITANLFGRWMMAAEADLTRTNELLMNHHKGCTVCTARLNEISNVAPPEYYAEEEQYPPEDAEYPFRAPARRTYRLRHSSVLQFRS
jgi:hypothetical protein